MLRHISALYFQQDRESLDGTEVALLASTAVTAYGYAPIVWKQLFFEIWHNLVIYLFIISCCCRNFKDIRGIQALLLALEESLIAEFRLQGMHKVIDYQLLVVFLY